MNRVLVTVICYGNKGAIISALSGGGGAALYTYKLRDKQPRF